VRSFKQILVIVVSLSILVTLMGGVASAQKEIELTYWGWPDTDRLIKDVWYPLFAKTHPDTNIKVEPIPMPWDQVHTKLFMALEAGSGAPDIVLIDSFQIQRFVKQGKLWELTKLIAPFRKDFLPYKLYNDSDTRGRVWAVPLDAGPVQLYYRKDIFDRNGIKVPIKTWDEYIEVGKKLRAQDIYMGTFKEGTGEETWFRLLYHQLGGSYFDKAGRPTLNSPEAKKTVTVIKRMVDADILFNVALWNPAWYSLLKTGKIAAFPMAVWQCNDLPYNITKPEEGFGQWRISALPAFEPGGSVVSNLGGSELAIPAQSKNKEAAWEFVKFCTTNIEARRAEAAFGEFPAYIPAHRDPQVYNRPYEFFGGQPIYKEFIDALATMPTKINYHPAGSEAVPIIDAELSKIYTGKVSIDEGLKTLQSKLETLAKKYR